MDCKAALLESNGDMEKAIDFLRKKGMASAAKRSGREAKEGLIAALVHRNSAVLVEANCETDFVARTDDFRALLNLALAEVDANGENAIASQKVADRVAELSGKIGEKILVGRAKKFQTTDGALFCYIHANQKLGVLIELSVAKDASKKNVSFQALGKDLAMQVAASNPVCVERGEVPAASVEREKSIYREEVKGKPENIVEKIIGGKLEKFYQTSCLIEQAFIKDDKKSVKALIEEKGKEIQDTIKIRRFARFQLGETVSQ
jgi:elongation factor Ts